MSDAALISELRATTASLVTSTAAAEAGDWAAAEQGLVDAQERSSRILRELSMKHPSKAPAPPESWGAMAGASSGREVRQSRPPSRKARAQSR